MYKRTRKFSQPHIVKCALVIFRFTKSFFFFFIFYFYDLYLLQLLFSTLFPSGFHTEDLISVHTSLRYLILLHVHVLLYCNRCASHPEIVHKQSTHICTDIRIMLTQETYIHTCTYIRVHTYIHTYTHTHTQIIHLHIHTYTHMHTYIRAKYIHT